MRHPKPYLKKSHHAYYYNQNGRPVRLCNEVDGEQTAYDKYYAIMAGRQPLGNDCRVFDLKERFLNHLANNRAQRTYDFYATPLESFVQFVGPNKRVYDLKAHHVTEWIDRCHKTAKRGQKVGKDENGKDKYVTIDTDRPIGDNYKRNLIRAVKACFKWGEDQEYIERSPIRKVKVPTATPRGDEAYLTIEQWDKLIAAIAKTHDHGALLDLTIILRETGCRPQEIRRVESRHFDRSGHCWVLPKPEAKGKQEARIIHLSDKAFDLCQRLALKYPEGPIFRNRSGNPWTRQVLNYRFYRLSKKLGFRVTPYSVRHTFATDCITKGIDLQTIATLMGHTDLKMLSKVYQHLRRRGDYLKEALRKATGEVA